MKNINNLHYINYINCENTTVWYNNMPPIYPQINLVRTINSFYADIKEYEEAIDEITDLKSIEKYAQTNIEFFISKEEYDRVKSVVDSKKDKTYLNKYMRYERYSFQNE